MNDYKLLADLLADPHPGLSSWCNAVLQAQRAIGFAPITGTIEECARAVEALPEGTWGDESGERCPWPIAARAVRALGLK